MNARVLVRALETKYPNVYAIGDIANTGTPKAGDFAEGAAQVVASSLIACIASKGEGNSTAAPGRAISSSVANASAASTSISFPAPSRQARIMSRA
jgi:NADH dehydrogenase FAD-containing subunit